MKKSVKYLFGALLLILFVLLTGIIGSRIYLNHILRDDNKYEKELHQGDEGLKERQVQYFATHLYYPKINATKM
jgi:hypothetical protein